MRFALGVRKQPTASTQPNEMKPLNSQMRKGVKKLKCIISCINIKQEICLRLHIQHTISGRGMIINA